MEFPNNSTHAHRTTFRAKIHGSESNIRNRGIEDFVQLFGKNQMEEIPFAKFKLEIFCTTDGVGQQFLQLCGKTVKETDLGGRIFENYAIEDVSELLRSCPNLKVIDFPYNLISRSGNIVKLFPDSIPKLSSLRKIRFIHDKVREGCPSFIEEFLTVARNVAEIVVNDNGRHNRRGGEEAGDISVLLNCIEKLGLESSIQSLSLHGVRDQHIEHLRRMAERQNGLKLTSLTVDLEFYVNFFDTIQLQLASIFRHTLQHLNVGRKVGVRLMDSPTIPNLISLTLRDFVHFLHQPVDLTQNFPALETLDLGLHPSCTNRMSNNCFSEFEPCHSLKALTVHNRHIFAIGIETFHNILRVFPNLTEIRWNIRENGGEILRQIWTQMTGLVSMSIRGCAGSGSAEDLELDSLFTGIPIETLKKIRHVGLG